jgi:chromosome segregation protein
VTAIFITQNGKITRRKFSISGGSVGLFEGKRIGRAKNLEKLQTEIKKLHHKLEDVEEKIKDKQSELDRAKGQTRKIPIELLRKETNLLQQELVSYETKQEQMAGLLSSNTIRREDILESIEQFNNEIIFKKPEADNLKITIESQFTKLEELSGMLGQAKEILDARSADYNEKNVLFIQQQNKLNSLVQEISYKENSRLAAEQRIEKNSRDLLRNEEEIKKLLESNDIGEDELLQLYNEKDSIEKGVNEAEREYYAQRGHIDELEKSLRLILAKKDNIDALLLELQTKVNELKLEISSVKNRLSVEFEVDPDVDATVEDSEQIMLLSIDELSNKVAEFKSALDRIGPVNPMALDAYEEIKGRHTFITEQKNDLVTAKESLLATIEEIDLVARETFVQSFEKIKTNFVKVFRSMFTEEDDCDLRMVNPGNPLESEIEVIAKPKGKKPLTISQLSGGEKALTAISLLFAIYLLKPAPFCIFDEVDAPLDDANIDKFNEKVRQFAEGSQFIIITHNKRTMTKTDVIYGITMIEQGVSRVVPVDLRSLE